MIVADGRADDAAIPTKRRLTAMPSVGDTVPASKHPVAARWPLYSLLFHCFYPISHLILIFYKTSYDTTKLHKVVDEDDG